MSSLTKLRTFFLGKLIIWLSKIRLETTESETENARQISRLESIQPESTPLETILESRLHSGEGSAKSRTWNHPSMSKRAYDMLTSGVHWYFKRRSFAWDGSEIVHKCQKCLTTCHDSTGVLRGRNGRSLTVRPRVVTNRALFTYV